MGVTRTTAVEIRQRALQPRGRFGESLCLVVLALLWGLGLVRVHGGVSEPFAGTEAALERGEIVNLNEITQPEALVPFLDFLSPAERLFVAKKIWQYRNRVEGGDLANVGELSQIHVAALEVEADEELRSFRTRLEELSSDPARAAHDPGLRLLTPAQLRELKPRVVVRTPSQFQESLRNHALLMLALWLAVHAAWRLRRFSGDRWVMPVVVALTGLGFLAMVSVRDPLRDLTLFKGFAQGVAGGFALLLIASQIDFARRFWQRLSFLFFALAAVLSILLIVFGSGPGTSDAKVNLLGFQPVEAMKLFLVFFLAGYFSERWEFLRELVEGRGRWSRFLRLIRLPQLEYVVPVVVAMGLVLLFFFLQRDLGPALVMSLLFLSLYGVARGGLGLVLLGFSLMGAGFFIGYRLGVPSTVAARVAMWQSPWENDVLGGDHLAKTLWALASGGLRGSGLGRGDSQLVPAVHTDMILAAVGEEIGFCGLLLVLVLFAVLIYRFLRISLTTGSEYGFFLALGMTLVLALQTLLIAGGVLGLLPLAGIATPFLSFGRSAMLANLFLVGVLLAISHHARGGGGSLRRLRASGRWIVVVLAVGLVGLGVAAARVQLLAGDRVLVRGSLARQADGVRRYQYNPRLVRIARQIPRGSILDRNGVPLASSDWGELEEYRPVYRGLGVELVPEPRASEGRYYPFRGLTFHLLGDLNSRLNWGAPNTSFAERDSRVRLQGYDDYAGVVEVPQPGGQTTRVIQRDYSELIPLLRHQGDPDHPVVGRILNRDRNLQTTVDIGLQIEVARILEKHVRAAGVKGGAAVFIDVDNGDLLANVAYPWPGASPSGRGSGVSSEAWFDRGRYATYPPGSSFKLVSAIAALRRHPDLYQKPFQCVRLGTRIGHRVRGWGKPIRDDPRARTPHGSVSMHKGIQHSCNAYFAQLVTYEVGAQGLLETAALFDIDVASPNTPERLQDALPQAAFGQGQVTATPFEMARVAAALAAHGRVPQGRWVLDDTNPRTREPLRVLPHEEARLIARSMRQAVKQGTAQALSDVSPPLAGKTGTAEVRGQRSHAWFVGFAPYGNEVGRSVAFSVVIENGGYGGERAAEAAGEMVERAAALGLIGSQPGA